MNSNENTILGFLVGTALGATLGILFAPHKGSKTRRLIADQAATAQDSLLEKTHEFQDRAISTYKDKKASFDDSLDQIVSDVSHKTEDVITSLESKLADLKTKNKRLQRS